MKLQYNKTMQSLFGKLIPLKVQVTIHSFCSLGSDHKNILVCQRTAFLNWLLVIHYNLAIVYSLYVCTMCFLIENRYIYLYFYF